MFEPIRAEFFRLDEMSDQDLAALATLLRLHASESRSEALRAFWDELCSVTDVEQTRRLNRGDPKQQILVDLPSLAALPPDVADALEAKFRQWKKGTNQPPLKAFYGSVCFALMSHWYRQEQMDATLERMVGEPEKGE
jgi:hypothetical protein